MSRADITARQILSQHLMSPREEGRMQERNNGRRDKERREDGAKVKKGNMVEGGGESKRKRTVEGRKRENSKP